MKTLDRIRSKKQTIRGVIYARFSTEMQRDESIDAQVRAVQEYANRNDIVIVDQYVDRAKSATTDNRPAFQQMIADAAKNKFEVVLVHKLDRFSRNRNDSIAYRMQLKRHGISLISALEYIDEDSPESIILESVLEAMAEYYSRNLAREVEKGKRENALKGKHVGGVPPLGYDLERTTMKLLLNPKETECVKLIFKMYLEGKGYSKIIDELNLFGYTTKSGMKFGANSLQSIIRNPKYSGVYTYNRSASKDVDGKRNGSRYKDDDEIIKIDGGVPAIVSKEDFEIAQEMLKTRKLKIGSYKAKEVYLLSGRIDCGECGSTYTGNSRRSRPYHPLFVSYRCCRHNKKVKCTNREIRRELLEAIVFDNLAQKVFDPELIPQLTKAYKNYLTSRHSDTIARLEGYTRQLKDIDKEIANLVSFIAKSGSDSVASTLTQMEAKRAEIAYAIDKINDELDAKAVNEEELTRAFNYARELFISGQLITSRKLVERFVHRVIMFHDHIEIYYNFGFSIEPIKRQVDAEIINRKRPEGVRSELLLKKDLARVSQEARAPSRVLNPPKNSGSQLLKVPIRREKKSVVCNVAGISSTSTLADAKIPQNPNPEMSGTAVSSLDAQQWCAFYGGERRHRYPPF